MVVLSAALVSKTRVLVARQFVEVSRVRIEGLLSAFLRLIEAGGKDHTYIETDSVRYVYLPLESLYLLLITNKHSNILEDLETLKLMQQLVHRCCASSVNEDSVLTNAFNIIFALDEVISFGYRENVTLSQVKTYMEMESHDEKLSLMVQEEKMREERRRGQKIATRLEKERKERQKKEQAEKLLLQRANKQLQLPSALATPTGFLSGPGSDTAGGDAEGTGVGGTALVTGSAHSGQPAGAGTGVKPGGRGMQLGRKKNAAAAELLLSLRVDDSHEGATRVAGGVDERGESDVPSNGV